MAGLREGAGDFHQVMRVHGASSGSRRIILRAAPRGTAYGWVHGTVRAAMLKPQPAPVASVSVAFLMPNAPPATLPTERPQSRGAGWSPARSWTRKRHWRSTTSMQWTLPGVAPCGDFVIVGSLRRRWSKSDAFLSSDTTSSPYMSRSLSSSSNRRRIRSQAVGSDLRRSYHRATGDRDVVPARVGIRILSHVRLLVRTSAQRSQYQYMGTCNAYPRWGATGHRQLRTLLRGLQWRLALPASSSRAMSVLLPECAAASIPTVKVDGVLKP